MLRPSHPINIRPKKWDELHRCKLFVKRPTLSALDSVRPQHRLKAQYRPTWCVYGSLMALLAILALYVCLFVFFFSFWSTISSLFLFVTCPILTHFGRHIVINLTMKATDKSHRALASWPQETTFRNLEWTCGFRGLWYSGTKICTEGKWLLLMAGCHHNCVFWFRKRICVKTNHVFQIQTDIWRFSKKNYKYQNYFRSLEGILNSSKSKSTANPYFQRKLPESTPNTHSE